MRSKTQTTKKKKRDPTQDIVEGTVPASRKVGLECQQSETREATSPMGAPDSGDRHSPPDGRLTQLCSEQHAPPRSKPRRGYTLRPGSKGPTQGTQHIPGRTAQVVPECHLCRRS